MGLILYLARENLELSYLNGLLFQIIAGAIIYIAFSVIIKDQALSQLINILRDRIRSRG